MPQPSDHSSLSVGHLSFLSLVDMIMIYSPSFSIRAHLSITHSLSTHFLSSLNTCPIQFFFLYHCFDQTLSPHSLFSIPLHFTFYHSTLYFSKLLPFHNHTYSACNLKTSKTKNKHVR